MAGPFSRFSRLAVLPRRSLLFAMFTCAAIPAVFTSSLRSLSSVSSLAACPALLPPPCSSSSRSSSPSPSPAGLAFCSPPVSPLSPPVSPLSPPVSPLSPLSSLCSSALFSPSSRSVSMQSAPLASSVGAASGDSVVSPLLPSCGGPRRNLFRFFASSRSESSLGAADGTKAAEKAPSAEASGDGAAGGGDVYRRLVSGTEGEKDFRVLLSKKSGERLSPWHDIPLFPNGRDARPLLFNMVVEIPKNTRRKMEMQLRLPFTPIMQDLKKDGSLREYASTLYWNYGAFPQTWEDPREPGGREVFHARGDGDPLDVVEIGSEVLPVGGVVPVKVLGALAMIDGGELDWKVLAIREGDPLFSQLNSVADVERLCRGVVPGIREWFRWYKLPTDNVVNQFGHDEAALPAADAERVVYRAHEHYLRLLSEEHEGEVEEGEALRKEDAKESHGQEARGRNVAVYIETKERPPANGEAPADARQRETETKAGEKGEHVRKQKLWLP
ncbi:type I inorganic pyrophosphatase PPase [Toxoplasma gondii RUB]|uniref:inorganic diphosphatase n=1 Tax=Toxoplasma gondii RUB TaxID=935652 RepID=A0A086M3F4_TOXGO|nr:type I inorganic pyrophosphatase PPase [Toxoplasma gondii RUB]